MRRRIASAAMAGAFSLLLGQCALPSSTSLPIAIFSDTITLEWDPPSSRFPSPPLATCAYRLYYSPHNAGRWHRLGELPASDHPAFVVHHDDVGDGDFDFGVSSVNYLGVESQLHASYDFLSSPVGGWHVRWVLSR